MSTACPHCKSGDTIISAQDLRDGSTKRTRFCRSCQTPFRTIEIVASSLPNLVNDNGAVRERWATHTRPSVRLEVLGRINT